MGVDIFEFWQSYTFATKIVALTQGFQKIMAGGIVQLKKIN